MNGYSIGGRRNVRIIENWKKVPSNRKQWKTLKIALNGQMNE